ncbi:META domain-containing protein [Pseudoflavitalea sp. G-6-1-2]|uniref:META domain-containing protein n=1 Tax=Pseudoflavitalea sp. G-6-1-2 TaxID=2728841 RepID=UPI00146B56A2|nr:META domain-containing protein [Pseudoflavitalea sp. G-6-1-2]NML19925.1 META domain-containing protein [Pseudoflavitalea sp. G-6-1-2]
MRTILIGVWLMILLIAATPRNSENIRSAIAPIEKEAVADTIFSGEWFLLPVLPSDTAAGEFPSIRFNAKKGHFTGHTGCNTMEGEFAYTDSTLQFGEPLRLSKKVCTGYNEAAFLRNFLRTNRYSFRDSMLIFWFDQTELMRWTRKPERTPVIKRA